MGIRLIVFLVIVLTTQLVLFVATGRRLNKLPWIQAKSGRRRLVRYIVVLCGLSLPLFFLLRYFDSVTFFSDVVAWWGYLSLAFFSTFLWLFLAADGMTWLGKQIKQVWQLIKRRRTKISTQPQQQENLDSVGQVLSRRSFLNTSSKTVAALGTAAVLTGYGLYEAHCNLQVKMLDVPIKNLPKAFSGFRIAQLTDIHVGPTIKRSYVEKVVNMTNRLAPDAIAITGDLVDGSVASLKEDVAPLKDLAAPNGVYFVTGNHEYYSGVDAWLDHVSNALNMTVLHNSHKVIEREKDQLVLAGIPDYTGWRFSQEHRSDVAKTLAQAPENAPKILLAHQPRSIFEAETFPVDLQISGHTHGGQFVPWTMLVGFTQPYVHGLYRHHEAMQIYVSRGTGYWGPPTRIGAPQEVTLLRLVAA